MSGTLDERLALRLHALDRAGLTRRPPAIADRDGARYTIDGRNAVRFCSNDYLGLADDPALRVGTDAPSGAGASRLICGDLFEHREVETMLADLVHAPDAVLFPSGFQLNTGVLPALLEASDVASSDTLNHASLIDGIRLSRARRSIVAHGRLPPPEALHDDGLHWWIGESIYSMDGDPIDPALLQAHLDRGGQLYLDEAHALGLFDGGAGHARHAGIAPTVLVGTLSKSLGCAGAFVAGSTTACDWLRSRCRSFVFSTGTSPALLPRIAAAVALVRGADGDARRERLWTNARRLAKRLGVPAPPSPIFPLLVGENDAVVAIAGALLDRGWHVQPIRPPTVPAGTARLRLTVSAAHSPEHIDGLAHDLREVFERHGRPIVIDRGRTQPLGPARARRAAGDP